jgi:hypothetical protein
VGIGALSNLWADHRESSIGFYIAIGGTAFALAVMALVAALRVLRGRHRLDP